MLINELGKAVPFEITPNSKSKPNTWWLVAARGDVLHSS